MRIKTCSYHDYRRQRRPSCGYYSFNVDGVHPLEDMDLFRTSFSPQDWQRHCKGEENLGADALTLEERIELLVNRCFIRVSKSDMDLYPYNDTYSLPIPQPVNPPVDEGRQTR